MSLTRIVYKFLSFMNLFNILLGGKKKNRGKRLAKHVVRKQSHKLLAKMLR
jgi:hypothetical protein